jgi:hypothetical protein
MAPTLVREPFHRNGWVYEEKVDGWRMLAYKDRDRVRLVSRNGRDHTRRFADIAAAIAKLSPRTLVLDGEVAIFDQQLRSRFEWLREPALRRSRHRRPSWRSICYIVTAATSPLGRFVIGGHGSRGAQHADAWRDGCSLQCHGRRRGGDCRARHDGGEALHRPAESVAFD